MKPRGTLQLGEELRPREDPGLAGRLAASAARLDGAHLALDEFDGWLAERDAVQEFAIERIPFAQMRGWHFEDGVTASGNLVHDSGRFFSVEGLRLSEAAGGGTARYQPILHQPEVGILGILAKEFDGVLHFLMQAKMEPGNPRPVMLSPTVQATRSNYTGVHQGAPVTYLEHFVGAGRGRVVADVLQSEHGDWFFHKRNRNMLVEVGADEEVRPHPDFCWLTLGQIHALLARDNVINMDSRTVLSCLPPARPADADPEQAVSSTAELLSWFTDRRTESEMAATRVPLRGLPGWRRDLDQIGREDGQGFRVIAIDVRAGRREVGSWTQPVIEPVGQGLAAFLVREFDGVPHVLTKARAEGGFLDAVELGPTVQCMNGDELDEETSPFLAQIRDADPARIRFDALHAEEGGRFRNAVSRYLIVDADDRANGPLPADHAWVSQEQLSGLLRHSQYVNVQARTLVACLNSL
ncbi:NDP-hexose 2,3-dehydratase family protein [Streptacidiphilus sp. MAP12-33]|uniref:NDP-hexose 2,3-dehydratase family protein n=1 Tax=Streptacidiphilus sp. MAP12-33 TaxID=3156266 RepID=UPI0035195A88